MLRFMFDLQRDFHSSLVDAIEAYSNSRDLITLLGVLPLAILFGAIHAMTPGHSKSILAAYIVGSGQKPLKALLTSFVLSITHIGSAVLLAVVANSLVRHTLVGAGRAPAFEWSSRALLILIGLWLIYRAIRAKPHLHGEGITAGVVAGLIPCPLTLLIMTFAMANSAPEAGLAFSAFMLLGVAAVLGSVAVIAAFARNTLVQFIDKHGIALTQFSRVFDAIAGAILTSIAIYDLTR